MKKVYSKSKEELFKELGVNKDGLNDTEVKTMEEKYGKNELVEGKKNLLSKYSLINLRTC